MINAQNKSFLTSDGLELAYGVSDFSDPWKDPPPILLLHSAMSCSERFFAWVPLLMRHYPVLRLDLRGHGRSQVPPDDQPLTIGRLCDDIREFMEHIGVQAAHFVGTSAGGYLTQRIAIDDPERVLTASLFGATPGLKRSQAKSWLPAIREKGLVPFLAETISDRFPIGECNPALVAYFLEQTGRNDPEFILKFIALMSDQDWSDEMDQITCPTLLIIPGLGKIGDNSAYKPMMENIPDVTIRIYENTPHNVWDFMPERCAGDLLAFLASKFGIGDGTMDKKE